MISSLNERPILFSGLLWYDDNQNRDLAEKVKGAIVRYKRKFGAVPNVCYVHPSELGDNGKVRVDGVRVDSKSTVLRHHFFVGVEE